MVAGKFYRFKFRAKNSVGYSEYSTIMTFPLADKPAKPNAPTKDESQSDKTTITMAWSVNADTQSTAGDITGYKLYMDDGNNGDFELIFHGLNQPDVRSYQAQGLFTGKAYRYKVLAENAVGES
jgi:hypothetical protein